MRITIDVDEQLLTAASDYVAKEMPAERLISIALETFVRVEAGKRLSGLGGTAPDAQDISRRREEP